MKVWFCGKYIDMHIGQEVTVFRLGSGHTVFGEPAFLDKVLAKHLVFKTQSGAVVKTDKENLNKVVGKAAANHYCVSIKQVADFEDLIHQNVYFWDTKRG